MANSLSSLRNKILLSIFIIAFVWVIFNLPFIFKDAFSDIKGVIEKSAGDLLGKDVTIASLGFRPYGEVILYGVRVHDREIDYLALKSCHIQFKLLPLVTKEMLVITEVILKEPVFQPPIKDLRTLVDKAKVSRKYRLELDKYFLARVMAGKVLFRNTEGDFDSIDFSFMARRVGEERLYSEGWINLETSRFNDYLLNDLFFFEFVNKLGYRLDASIADNTLSLDSLILDFAQFKIEAKGTIKNYDTAPIVNLTARLKDLDIPEKLYLTSKLFITTIRNAIAQITGILKEPRWSVSLDVLRGRFGYLPATLKIDNFYCNLELSKEELVIEDLSCFFNNFPVGLNCRVSKRGSPSIELNILSHPGQIASLRPLNPLNFEFSFSGKRVGGSITGKTDFKIERLISPDSEKRQKARLTMDNFSCRFLDKVISSRDEKPIALLSVKARGIAYRANLPGHGVKLDVGDFDSMMYPDGTRIYFKDLNLSAYEGLLKGDGFLGFKRLSPELFLDFEAAKFSMMELINILHLDYDLAGDVAFKGILDSQAFFILSGKGSIMDGYMKNIELLNLISDFLGISSLKDIYFDDISSDFSFSALRKELDLKNIKLHSKDIYLDANLALRDKKRVKGDMLARVSTGFLKESFKLRLLFLLTGKKLPYADFEFKIGGFLDSPRIKWLDTNFRRYLKRYLSKKGQKVMEANIEEAIKPLLK
ncbi:hypothetical protein ACFL28_02515 [Candidatus Omnitrophota bacterium]